MVGSSPPHHSGVPLMSLYLTGAPNLQLHPLSGFGAPDPLPGVCFFSFFHIEILLLLGQVCVCSVTHFTCKDGVDLTDS